MSQHNINDAFWDDPEVQKLKQAPRDLFNYLMQSPRANLFGIYRIDFQTLKKHRSLTRQQAIDCFLELSAKGFVHYDLEREVVWVVNRARHAALSPKHWLGVGRVLECLYKSPLVGAFVRYYRRVFIGRGKKKFLGIDADAADELMELSAPSPTQPFDLWLRSHAYPETVDHRLSTACGESPQLSLLDSAPTANPYPIRRVVEVDVEEKLCTDSRTSQSANSLSAGAHARSKPEANPAPPVEVIANLEAQQTERYKADKARMITPPSATALHLVPAPTPPPTPSAQPPPHREAILRLWSEQESERSAIRAEGIDPHTRSLGLVPGETHLALVKARLEEHGEEVCLRVQACFAAEARRKRTLEHFNGYTNWRPEPFARMMASSPEREAEGRYQRTKRTACGAVPSANPYAGVVERLADGSTRVL